MADVKPERPIADADEYLRLLRNKVQQIMAKSPRMESMPGLEAVARPETIDPSGADRTSQRVRPA